MRDFDTRYGAYQNVNPLVNELRMRLDMHTQFHLVQYQIFDTGDQSLTVLARSKLPAVRPPHIPKAQLHLHVRGTSQDFGQMPKVEGSLKAKVTVGGRAVHLRDE